MRTTGRIVGTTSYMLTCSPCRHKKKMYGNIFCVVGQLDYLFWSLNFLLWTCINCELLSTKKPNCILLRFWVCISLFSFSISILNKDPVQKQRWQWIFYEFGVSYIIQRRCLLQDDEQRCISLNICHSLICCYLIGSVHTTVLVLVSTENLLDSLNYSNVVNLLLEEKNSICFLALILPTGEN